MRRARVRQILYVVAGWLILAMSFAVMSIPVPLPIPVGAVLMLLGVGILSRHSRAFRHWLRLRRHRHSWLSNGMERFGAHAPKSVQTMVHRTRPAVIERHARRQAARIGI